MGNTIIPSLAVDYVVEQGTSGIWTYRKWSNGTSECWGRGQWTTTLVAWGYIYSTNGYGEFNYPTGLFIATPSAHVQSLSSSAGDGWVSGGSGGTKDKTPKIGWNRATNIGGSQTFIADIYAIGRWK